MGNERNDTPNGVVRSMAEGSWHVPIFVAVIGMLGLVFASLISDPCRVPVIRGMLYCPDLLSEDQGMFISPIPTAPPGSVEVTMYSSNTKEDWLNAATAAFNAAEVKTSAGNPIFVRVEHVNSGSSMQDILDGEIKPTIWSPGEQSWVQELNQVWQDRTGKPLIPDPCHATVYAPVGFAMWRQMAEAMGWPHKPIGWNEIIELAANPEGWAKYGHPEWRRFKFGHTHPDHSNSGLLILLSLAHAVLGRTDELTAEMVKDDRVKDAMRTVELNTYHYGIASRDNFARMMTLGESYLHATNTTEAETLRTNSSSQGELPSPLVFIFPAEGTFWPDHPFCVLHAEWTSDEQREAAKRFGEYLLERDQQVLAVENYLRPLDLTIPLTAPFTLENGTDPSVTPATVPMLPSPSQEATGAIKDLFHLTKKKATIVIVLDTSGSMEGDKLLKAQEGTTNFIKQLDRDDEIYVYAFSHTVTPLSPSGQAREVAETLGQSVDGLYADGGTALYDAVCTAVQKVKELKSRDIVASEKRLYGVVVLSDGEDTASSRTENDMFNCFPKGEDAEDIKIFTIAYGEDAYKDLLLRIANRTNGKAFEGKPETIEQAYIAISAEQ